MLLGFLHQIWEVFSAPSLQLFLLTGSAILAIALFLLTLTRWGHARPVTKCVILSVIAHILLLGYAYGTKLIFSYPQVAKPEPIELRFSEFQVQIQADEQPVDSSHDHIGKFAPAEITEKLDELPRPIVESELELQHTAETDFHADIAIEPPAEPSIADDPVENENIALEPSLDFDATTFNPNTEIQNPTETFEETESEPLDEDPLPEIEISDPAPVPSSQPATDSESNGFEAATPEDSQFESELLDEDAEYPLVEDPGPVKSKNEEFTPSKLTSNQSSRRQFEKGEKPEARAKAANIKNELSPVRAVPKIYSLRSEKKRNQSAKKRGGSEATERAVALALEWLAKTQKPDGSWSPRETEGGIEKKVLGHDRGGCGTDSDTGVTALATLAFLGAGNSHLEGNYRVTVQKSLEYLIGKQRSNGDLAGNARLFARMYCHSMSLLALSEALAVTGDQRLRNSVRRGVHYTVESQNPIDGGWRYQPGDRGDMSQFGWQVLALHSAAVGGIEIESRTIDRMHTFLELCSMGNAKGLAAYRPGQGPSTTMTAEALMCRHFMRSSLTKTQTEEAQRRILRELPSVSGKNFYYWYYGTTAMFQSGGSAWDQWNRDLQQTLLPMQVQGGPNVGSWKPDGLWSGYGGRVYSTAMATLCLEVYYRYLPMYEVASKR